MSAADVNQAILVKDGLMILIEALVVFSLGCVPFFCFAKKRDNIDTNITHT